MTDKQIIIDNVDVSGCSNITGHVNDFGEYECLCRCIFGDGSDDYGVIGHEMCKDNPNCYYKQFKRKEQECERLKKELHKNFEEKDTLHLIIDRLLEASGYDTNTASAEDFEDVYEHMRYEQQQLDQFKAEVELLRQYKGSKQASYESMQIEWNKAVSQNQDLLKQNEEWQKQVTELKAELEQEKALKGTYLACYKAKHEDIEGKLFKLKQTLTEIKEIAENGKRFAERYMITGEQKANVLTYANAILQKISEVENE